MNRLLVLATLVLCALAVAAAPALARTPAEVLADQVDYSDVRKHLKELQEIADQNGGNRGSITPGYEASVDYVAAVLRKAGYDVTIQEFTFQFVGETAAPEFERVSPDPETYQENQDFITMTYSGSGDVTANLRPVDVVVPIGSNPDNTSTSGCEPTDFTAAGFQAGEVALLQRGTCPFRQKAENAKAAGASAVVIMNEGQAGRSAVFGGTLGPPRFDRPVIGTSYAVGAELVELWRNDPNVTVHAFTETVAEDRQSSNVLAEAKVGDPNNITMSGAHLDSVLAGPGINDNGSGTAALLEVAVELARKFDVNDADSNKNDVIQNRPRFAWWGAEEQGLIGSRYYTSQVTPAQREQIDLYLNYDMNGSPNFVRFVGDGSTSGPPGSDKIEQLYIDYFTSVGLATDPTPFDNRSDYGAFTPHGIPAGFLFTGAEGTKTTAQAAVYGGTAGMPYDPCYHQACDTLGNVNEVVHKQMLQANAFAKTCWLTNPPLDHGVGGPAPGACFSPPNDD